MIVKGKAIYHAATGRFNTVGSMKLKSFYVVAQSAKNILSKVLFSLMEREKEREKRRGICPLIKVFQRDRVVSRLIRA